jgi:hypothetical protein
MAKTMTIWSTEDSFLLLTKSRQFITTINPLLKFPTMNSVTAMMEEMLCRALSMFKQRKPKVHYRCWWFCTTNLFFLLNVLF